MPMPLNRKQRRRKEALARKAAKAQHPQRINARHPSGGFRLSAGDCKIQAAEGDGKLPTFKGNAYTGAQMRPMGWWEDLVVDLAGVQVSKQQRPVLRQHSHDEIVGHTTVVRVDAKEGILVEGVLSGEQQHVDKVLVPGQNGFPWQLSIGADPVRTEFLEAGETATVNGREVTGPLVISRETKLGEISFVPLGADDETSATISARKGETMNGFKAALKQLMAELRAAAKAAKYSDGDIDKMSVDEAKNALKEEMSAAEDEDAEAADDDEPDEDDKPKSGKKNAVKATTGMGRRFMAEMRNLQVEDTRRCRDISAACKQHGMPKITATIDGKESQVDLAEHAIMNDWSVEKVKASLLDILRTERPNTPTVPGGMGYVVGNPEMGEAVLEAAIFHAARHQMRLQDDSFYFDTAPDGKTSIRRVPLHLQREAQSGFGRYTDKVQQAAHDMFVNARHQNYVGQFGLQMLFLQAMRAKGITERFDLKNDISCERMLKTWSHTEPGHAAAGLPIMAEGASNLSISNILSNVLNKFALQGYLYVEQVWRKFCAIRSVNDFKPSKSINLLGDVMYKQLGPTGELMNASLGDQAFANQAAMFGRILTIPIMHLMNDDLGILTGAPTKIGQGAGLALNDNVWTLFKNMLSTVNGDDGNPFFRTTSSTTAAAMKAGTAYKPNKTTGALTAATLATAKALLDNQIDPNGNPLGLMGGKPVMLFGPSNWVTAMSLLQAPTIVYGGASAALQPDKNMFAGYAEPAMSSYMENANYINSTTAYFLIFEAHMTGIIEVCFLNGTDTPAVLQAGPDFQFDRPGISIRGTMPFGSTQQNFRCGVYSTGA